MSLQEEEDIDGEDLGEFGNDRGNSKGGRVWNFYGKENRRRESTD